MIRKCAWCGLDMGGAEPLTVLKTTHSICPDCAAKMEADARVSCKRVLVRVDRSMPACQRAGGL